MTRSKRRRAERRKRALEKGRISKRGMLVVYRCPVCGEGFTEIEDLFDHQGVLNHYY